MKTVKVYWDHDAGWTDDDHGNADLCGPWHEIPEDMFKEYLEARDVVWTLERKIKRHIKGVQH